MLVHEVKSFCHSIVLAVAANASVSALVIAAVIAVAAMAFDILLQLYCSSCYYCRYLLQIIIRFTSWAIITFN